MFVCGGGVGCGRERNEVGEKDEEEEEEEEGGCDATGECDF